MKLHNLTHRRSFLKRTSVALAATAVSGGALSGRPVGAQAGEPGVVREPARDVPVLGQYDVVVCGGGPAGCAAAAAAARHGAKTLLLEKGTACGGKAVHALVAVVLSTNGVDFQGVWHEWARLLHKRGGMATLLRSPSHYYKTDVGWFRSSFDPEMAKWAWETLLDEAGAELLFDAAACGVVREGASVTGVLCQTIAGRRAVLARRVIDATGHGLICDEAGVPWHRGVDDKLWAQAVHLNYHIGWTGTMPGYTPGEIVEGLGGTVGNKPLRRAWAGPLKQVDPLDPRDVTRAIRTLRTQTWRQAQRMPAERYLAATAAELGDRTLRIIRGVDCVTADDAFHYRKRPDGIARSSWELDVHPADDSPIPKQHYHSLSAEYAKRNVKTAAGDYFDIPYGALLPEGVDNLLAAGRIVSSELASQGSLRIQQTCMATGQAAGTAAALSLRQNVAPRELDVQALLEQLAADRAAVAPAFEQLADLPIVAS